MKAPTFRELIAMLKDAGFVVNKSSSKVNGMPTCRIEGFSGLATKNYMMNILEGSECLENFS